MLSYAWGIRLLEAKKAPVAISRETAIRGVSTRTSEIPAAFIASNSLFSPKPPIVIIEASRVARGRARGIKVAAPHPINSRITPKLNPFPTSSSIYSHKKCIIRIKITMRNVSINGPRNDWIMNLSNFFNIIYFVADSTSLANAA